MTTFGGCSWELARRGTGAEQRRGSRAWRPEDDVGAGGGELNRTSGKVLVALA
jgi:hypothetical protein